jgi:hypothetical protein
MELKQILRELIEVAEETLYCSRPAYSRSGKSCSHCDEYNGTEDKPRHGRGCQTLRLEKLIKNAKAAAKETDGTKPEHPL